MISNNYNIVNKSIGFGNQTTNPNCSAQKRHSFTTTQKVIAGATIGVTALAMILARKNISSFVKKLFGKGEEAAKDLPKNGDEFIPQSPNPKPEPKAVPKQEEVPEAPKTTEPTEQTPTPEPPKAEAVPVFDGAKALAEYWRIVKERGPVPNHFESPEALARWNELDEKLRIIYRQLRDNNVSMTIKKEFSPNKNEQVEEKRHYLYNAQCFATTNLASKLDYLEVFGKYGDRSYRDGRIGCNTIKDLTKNTSSGPNNAETISKYVAIMKDIAKNDNAEIRDAVRLVYIFEENAKIMKKETILDAIKLAKDISFQLVDAEDMANAVSKTQFKDDKEVLSALEDLEAHLKSKNYPYRDRTQND